MNVGSIVEALHPHLRQKVYTRRAPASKAILEKGRGEKCLLTVYGAMPCKRFNTVFIC